MWIGLLWIIGCYGAAVAFLHIWFGTRRDYEGKPTKVLVIAKNNAMQIEWYIRSMFFLSRMKGKELIVTVMDEGSTDETMKIIERLSHSNLLYVELDIRTPDEYLKAYGDDIVVLHISNRGDMVSIPAF